MLRFFSKIRYQLAAQNRVAKYLRYAIGEILLVMIGILIALQINNWNEEQKKDKRRIELIENIITDFETSKSRLLVSLNETESAIQTGKRYLNYALLEKNKVSIDTLQNLGKHAFLKILFKPAIASYETALNTGDFGLIKSRRLTEAISEFMNATEDFNRHLEFGGQIVFNGGLWELRKSLGINTLEFRENYTINEISELTGLSETEYKNILTGKLATASVNNMMNTYFNMKEALMDAYESSEKIINELKTLSD